jgi:trehalose utilization protein
MKKTTLKLANIYPNGIHEVIAQHLASEGLTVQTATLAQHQPEHGLTDTVLQRTDVLIIPSLCNAGV